MRVRRDIGPTIARKHMRGQSRRLEQPVITAAISSRVHFMRYFCLPPPLRRPPKRLRAHHNARGASSKRLWIKNNRRQPWISGWPRRVSCLSPRAKDWENCDEAAGLEYYDLATRPFNCIYQRMILWSTISSPSHISKQIIGWWLIWGRRDFHK